MSATSLSEAPANSDLAARFAAETAPLLDALARGARRLTHREADAEDLLQDTLLHAYAGFGTFASGSNLQAWLFRILYNRWVSNYRSKQRRPVEVSVEQLGGPAGVAGVQLRLSTRSAEEEALAELPDGDLRAALAALPSSFQQALYYADALGYTYAETAALLQIPMGTVMSRVSRGRQRLRVALRHLYDVQDRDARAA